MKSNILLNKKRKKFCPYVNSNLDIYLHYNKNFKLPRCMNSKKKCYCFPKKKIITFSFVFPMSFIQFSKKHISKNITEIENHNNMAILNFDSFANFTKVKVVKMFFDEHKNTLNVFKKFLNYSREKQLNVKTKKFESYIKNQAKKCDDFYNLVIIGKKKFTSFTCTKISLYSHYHTLKLFECFVNKLN